MHEGLGGGKEPDDGTKITNRSQLMHTRGNSMRLLILLLHHILFYQRARKLPVQHAVESNLQPVTDKEGHTTNNHQIRHTFSVS